MAGRASSLLQFDSGAVWVWHSRNDTGSKLPDGEGWWCQVGLGAARGGR